LEAFVYFWERRWPARAIAAMFVKGKRANIALQFLLLVQYRLVPTLSLMGVGR
jgi:hypothetical protein